ncbi:hypothetical protein ACFQZ4_43720 [Catellatospora coxensis]
MVPDVSGVDVLDGTAFAAGAVVPAGGVRVIAPE